jgi:ATP-dependent helicase HrpA
VREAAGRLIGAIAAEYHAVALRLAASPPALKRVATDVKAQLASLVYKGSFSATPWEQLQHLPRYLKAMTVRIDKYAHDPERDARHAAAIAEFWKLWQERSDRLRKSGDGEPRLADFRWQIEELRVSLFAQELRTPFPVSVKRLKKIWNAIAA